MVAADGQLRQVGAQSEADLFRALLAGKSFGVVTAMECALFAVTRYGWSELPVGADSFGRSQHGRNCLAERTSARGNPRLHDGMLSTEPSADESMARYSSAGRFDEVTDHVIGGLPSLFGDQLG